MAYDTTDYASNPAQTNVTQLRLGNVMGTVDSGTASITVATNVQGAPIQPIVGQQFYLPAVADDDRYLAATVTTTDPVTWDSADFVNDTPTSFPPIPGISSGRSRNVIVTLGPTGGATDVDGTVVVVIEDSWGKRQTLTWTVAALDVSISAATNTLVADGGGACAIRLISVTADLDTSVAIKVGTGNTFGLVAAYTHPLIKAGDLNGALLTLSTDIFFNQGQPDTANYDRYGSVKLGATDFAGGTNAPNGTNRSYTICYTADVVAPINSTSQNPEYPTT